MNARYHPVGVLNPPQVVVFPDEIDIANSAQVSESLRAVLSGGAAVVVADLTRTTYSDTSGARVLLIAAKWAAASHVELRVALPEGSVRRTLRLLGLDHLLRIYPTVTEAVIT